jgi:cytoskeletal protein CcmA (bactofilin family)
MTLKDFMANRERGSEAAEAMSRPAVTQVPSAPRTVSPSTSVDASSELEGKLRCKQTLRIDGCIKGEVECERSVLIGEGARVIASIDADEVQIAGTVEGDITARRKITLERTANVKGDLTTPGIVIEEGAKLRGRIVIGSEAEADAKAAKPPRKAAAPQASEASSPQPLAAIG